MSLTDLGTVKSYLRISQSDTSEDSFLSLLINSAQSTIEKYCHRHFDVNTYTEQHNINHKIFPREYPIKSVESIVRYGDMSIIPDNYNVTNYRLFSGYVELLDYKVLTMSNRLRYVDIEESYVEISYTAGFDEIPGDLCLAATKLVALEYKESREDRLGIEQEQEGDVRYTYMKKESAMPLNIQAVLDRYKKVRV